MMLELPDNNMMRCCGSNEMFFATILRDTNMTATHGLSHTEKNKFPPNARLLTNICLSNSVFLLIIQNYYTQLHNEYYSIFETLLPELPLTLIISVQIIFYTLFTVTFMTVLRLGGPTLERNGKRTNFESIYSLTTTDFT